jgi:hypothetical protein
MLCCVMQALQALHADAIMGIALPMPHSDSCGCVMSHLLGAPFIDINGHPLIDAPVTVPQVRVGRAATAQSNTARMPAYSQVTSLVSRLSLSTGFVPVGVFAGLPSACVASSTAPPALTPRAICG